MRVTIDGVTSIHDNGDGGLVELFDADEELLASISYDADFSLNFEQDEEE